MSSHTPSRKQMLAATHFGLWRRPSNEEAFFEFEVPGLDICVTANLRLETEPIGPVGQCK
jgi:hypothetical protein